MDKSITSHYINTKRAIDALEENPSPAEIEALYRSHIDRVHDFQHERLIHLMVTFFFSALLIAAIVGLLWVASMSESLGLTLTYLFAAISAILFVTVLFYIRHYYQLENGVQNLYTLTEKLQILLR